MMGVLSVFTGPWGWLARFGVILVAVLAFGAYSWFKGNEHGTQKLLDYQARQLVASVEINRKRAEVSERVVTRYVKVKGETETVTRYVEKEVVKYAQINPGYCLDALWRVQHDHAAANAVPGAAAKPDGSRGAPKAAEALEGVTENYAGCHRTADRLDALQEWVREQRKVK